MIISKKHLSIAETKEFLDQGSDMEIFSNKFSKLSFEDAKEMKKKIEDLESINIRDEHIVKIIDVLPDNAQDLNKIFVGGQIDEDEIKKVLEIVQEYK